MHFIENAELLILGLQALLHEFNFAQKRSNDLILLVDQSPGLKAFIEGHFFSHSVGALGKIFGGSRLHQHCVVLVHDVGCLQGLLLISLRMLLVVVA